MKRVLSLVLALVLVLGSMPLAFADEHMTAGDQLYEWNLIAGRSATEKELDEEGTLNRAELMVLFAQLNGVVEDAENFELPSGFSDVDAEAWYAPFVAYGKMAGWTAGYPDGTFKPMNAVSAQEMAAFVLNVLNYEVVWASAMEDAAAIGIDVEVMNTAMLTRGEGFAFMLAAVNTVPNGATEKLGVQLGVLEPEAPVVVTPEELEVVSVEALNLVQIEVVFNQEVDKESAEKTDNYSVEDEDFDLQDATLLEDGVTVILTLDLTDDIPSQEEVSEVTVEGVEDLDENEVIEATFEVEFLDKTFPEAVKAEVVGNDTIKVFFSEPIKTFEKDDFDVEDYYVKSVTAANNATEINVEVYGTLEEGMLTVEVDNDVEDFAGYSILSQVFEIEVVEDDEAPFVVGYKNASATEVTLIFNEDIEFVNFKNYDGEVTNASDDDDFYHTNTKNVFDKAEIDGAELTLKFDEDYEMPEGTVYLYVNGNAVNDLWDNENESTLRVAIELEIDNEKPVVLDVYTDEDREDRVVIEFNEDVKFDEDEPEDYFQLLDSDGDDADIDFDFVTQNTSDEITLEFDEELSGDYTLVIEGFEDRSGNVMDKIAYDFTAEDVTSPDPDDFSAKVYDAGEEDQMLKISFDQEMATSGKYSVDDIEKYTIVHTDGTKVKLSSLGEEPVIDVVDNGKAVEITIPSSKDEPDAKAEDVFDFVKADVDTNEYDVRIARVADAAGNFMDEFSADIDIVGEGKVEVKKIEATDTDEIKVTLKDRLDDIDDDDFVVYVNTTASVIEVGVDLDEDSDGNSVVVLTILEDDDVALVDYDATNLMVEIVKDADRVLSENRYGEEIDYGLYTNVVDKIAPEVQIADKGTVKDIANITVTNDNTVTNGVIVVVTFEELLNESSVSNVSVVDIAGYEYDGGNDEAITSVVASGNQITIRVKDTDEKITASDFYEEDIVFATTIRDFRGNNKIGDTRVEIPTATDYNAVYGN